MNKTKAIILAAGGVVVIGGAILAKLDNWFSDEPTGPGSGDELPADYVPEAEYFDAKDRGRGPGEPGPGSGDELEEEAAGFDRESIADLDQSDNPGPGSGDELPDENGNLAEEVDMKDYGSGPGVPGPGSGDELPDDYVEPTGPGSGDELTDEFLINNAKYSCDVITDASTCVEYHGDYWNNETAALNCGGEGIFKSGACPRPAVGGCRANPGDYTEFITWHYDSGGDPFTGEVLPYSIKACNSMPTAEWILGN